MEFVATKYSTNVVMSDAFCTPKGSAMSAPEPLSHG